MKERETFIKGLRELADFLEANAAIPLPSGYLSSYIFPSEFKAIAKEIGSFDKDPQGDYFAIERKFVGGITYRLITDRDAVCQRVVVGKRVVPAEPEREEEIVEWECGSLLAE